MKEFVYDVKEKDKCWYKSICDGKRCGNAFCIRHYKMSCLVHYALMEGKQKYKTPLNYEADGTDKDIFLQLQDIQNDVNNFVLSGKNLLLYSANTGNGKTSWALKIMLSWFNSIWADTDLECRGLFISLPKLMSAMKENIGKPNEYFQYVNDNIVNADLVIWDELNYKEYTGFEHDFLLNVLSQRAALGKANIFTTNYLLPAIIEKLGNRLSSRIVDTSIKVEFKGRDKRNLGVE